MEKRSQRSKAVTHEPDEVFHFYFGFSAVYDSFRGTVGSLLVWTLVQFGFCYFFIFFHVFSGLEMFLFQINVVCSYLALRDTHEKQKPGGVLSGAFSQ